MIELQKRDKVYRHTEVHVAQAPKKEGAVLGDVVQEWRTPEATIVAVCDGIGSGVKANLSALLCASRIFGLLKHGFSLLEASERVVATMHEARTSDIPFSAFTLARVGNDGAVTIISYEMPSPIFIGQSAAYIPPQHYTTLGSEVICETHWTLSPGDALILTSDGVSQAGLGINFRQGWTMEGAAGHVNGLLDSGIPIIEIPERLISEAKRLSGGVQGDDTTGVLLTCRLGTTVHILTGPPLDSKDDDRVVDQFMNQDGVKVVCGSVTSEIVSRAAGLSLTAGENPLSAFEPPRYFMDGIELVTEGAVTLNQAFNILDEKPEEEESESPVNALCLLLRQADRVIFWVGRAANPGHGAIIFRQIGVQPRGVIIPLIAEKLRKQGKLVVVNYL